MFVWVFALLLSSVSCLVCVGFLSSYGDSSMDLSILPSSTFGAHCLYYHVAIALLRGIEICNWLSGLLNDLARAICVGRKKGFFLVGALCLSAGHHCWTEKRLGLSTRGSKKDCFKRMVGHMRTQVDHCTEG